MRESSATPTGNRPHKLLALTVVGLAAALALSLVLMRGDSPDLSPPEAAAPVRGEPAAAEEDLNGLVKPPPGRREEVDGLAVALVIDTSTSMRSRVRDARGLPRSKLDIARDVYREAVARVADFAGRRPELPLQVGVYEFSGSGCRTLLALGPLDRGKALEALERLSPRQGTPVGEAILAVKRDLDRSGLRRKHILLLTDGESTRGRDPAAVARAIARLPVEEQAAIHFLAFDVEAAKFNGIKDAGGTVLEATDGKELDLCMDFVLHQKILAEKPEVRRAESGPGD